MTQSLTAVRVINPVLTTVAQGYRQQGFIGEFLFPRVSVLISGGKILEFGKESFKLFRSLRAPGGATRRISYGYQGKDYALRNHSLEGILPRENLRDAKVQPGIDLSTRAMNLPMKSLTLELEVDQAALALAAGNYDVNHKIALTGGDKWSDDLSVPQKQIDTYKESIRESTGMYPNVLALSAKAFKAIRNNPSVVDRFKYVSKDSITPEMIANLLDIEKVVVGKGIVSDEGDALSDIWGNNALLAYVALGSISAEEPSYGYTYVMEGHPLVEQAYYDNNAKSWIYPVAFERAPVLSGITAGFLIQNPS